MALLTFKGVNRIFNIHVKMKGELSPVRPLILISNHSSYIDILVLGCCLPIAFTPKKEIKSWPIIGYCCRLAGCVFVDRNAKSVKETQDEIAKRLESGRVMCIFAEGTTNNGTQLKPFKSSLFSLAVGSDVQLQPMVIRYIARDNKPLDAAGKSDIAWYDDMALLPHLWRLLNFRRIDAEIELLPLIEKQPEDGRKQLCEKSETVIHQAFTVDHV